MTTVDYARRVSSGGAFGYYDGYPTGQLPGTGFTASFASDLHNTWIISKDLGAGSAVAVLFGQQSANPATTPTPNLFDVSLSFSGSIAVYGVDVGGLSLTSDSLSIEILGDRINYSGENLDTLLADLLNAGIPQETADDFVGVIEAAMGTIDVIEAEAFRIYNSVKTADFSGMENLVSVDLTSGMATASEDGTPVNIGDITHVMGTAHDDRITGNAVANILRGGAGADKLFGGGGDDVILFDAADTVVQGGAGWDIGIVEGTAGAVIDMEGAGLEAVAGGAGDDVIVLRLGRERTTKGMMNLGRQVPINFCATEAKRCLPRRRHLTRPTTQSRQTTLRLAA